jgi:hypothetical protein
VARVNAPAAVLAGAVVAALAAGGAGGTAPARAATLTGQAGATRMAGTAMTAAATARAAAVTGPVTGAAATMLFHVVPAMADVGVDLDGTVYRTDASGFVAIATTSGWHHIRILTPPSLPSGFGLHFVRWLDGISLTSREIQIPAGSHVQEAGFVVARPISVRFTDEKGGPVPLSEVGQITLTNGVGQRFTFRPSQPPPQLAVDRMVRNTAGLAPLPIRYSVRSVMIDGSNVVFDGSQKFSIGPHGGHWTVKVLIFPLQVKVRDALFKFGIASAVRLRFPNGSTRVINLGPAHSALITGLPRGNYEVTSQGPGLGFSTPVTLSGPQSATLLMLSWVDILLAAAFAVFFLIGLPLVGGRIVRRPGGAHRLAWQADPDRRPASPPVGVLPTTKIMPAITDAFVPARSRGRRRRP